MLCEQWQSHVTIKADQSSTRIQDEEIAVSKDKNSFNNEYTPQVLNEKGVKIITIVQ